MARVIRGAFSRTGWKVTEVATHCAPAQPPPGSRAVGLLWTVCAAFVAGGCHSAPPRALDYPAFYQERGDLPRSLLEELTTERQQVIDQPASGAAVLRYARAAARLARHEAALWLADDLASSSDHTSEQRLHLRHQQRVQESTRQALGLYSEARFLGARPDWRDHAERVWLLTLLGRDAEALGLLHDVLALPECPAAAADDLRALRARLEGLPEATP